MFDGDTLLQWGATGANAWFGMAFREGYVGQLSKIKYYVPGENSKDDYIDNTMFQGSNDGSTWDTLFTVDDTVASGWNYRTWDDATL